MATVEALRQKTLQQNAQLLLLEKSIKENSDRVASASASSKLLDEVNIFFAEQIKHKVSDIKFQIESLVNQGLDYIFNENIKIRIDSAFKNNKTVFSLKIVKDNLNEGITESFGGGVLAVVSCLLKISSIIITKTERLLVMDESLAYVSIEYQEKLSKFLQQICKQMNFTIILVTHQPLMAKHSDTIYRAEGNPHLGIKFKHITAEEIE